jgi:hypothetical protein
MVEWIFELAGRRVVSAVQCLNGALRGAGLTGVERGLQISWRGVSS